MAYRRKRYVGRAEKYRRHARVYRLLAWGALAFALVWLLWNWRYLYDYVRIAMLD